MRRGARDAGFTLLEILVALVVLGFLLVGLSEGVRFGLHAWDSESKLVNRRADMDGVERVLRGLIAAADPGDFNEPSPWHGKPHTLDFVSRLPMAAADLPSRQAAIGLGVDAKHRLVLRWSPHPHAERLTTPPRPQETVLLEGVEAVAFSYQRWPDQGGGWVETWDLPTLPQLVRVTISFPKDDRRHWPAIEAAPMLSRNDQ
jgi:general secretion pathway protein J